MTHDPPIRLLVVDDHTLFRRGLIALLSQYADFQVVGEAADAGEAQRRALALQPQVILLDNHLSGVSGIAALPALREAAPATHILMLTVSEDEKDLGNALKGGARGYVLKTVDGDELADAIRRTARGEAVVSADMTGKLVSAFKAMSDPVPAAAAPSGDLLDSLSPREQEILRFIAQGASNKAIARSLDIAETTVKIHVQHILRKLKLSSRVQAAVVLAGRSGV
ncbi:LuxR C-terminal-related transcriptional regulator [Aquabacterium sp. A7-Y]|uniref:LuxR C-terminal-related transcriptional regulator n=1 Tax=Aquabacterium sp. A7-Y TaxID=1349605 RepID=UPI00223DA464|nr:LuxR C-terminal-related transcriptional regulator [Aquabacterium sp. A7-Y]MCW7541612.1 LuxR C-terminal-related transcriptional regulator [Aquabacterium sp. A7-Y]